MNRFLTAVAAFVIAIFCLPLCSCSQSSQGYNAVTTENYYFMAAPTYSEYTSSGSTAFVVRGNIMGSDVTLCLATEDNFSGKSTYTSAVEVWQSVREMLIKADKSISLSYSDSPVSVFNSAAAGSKVELDETSYKVLTSAMELYTVTDGYFNPAVYPSALLYGFTNSGAVQPQTLPENAITEAYMALYPTFSQIILSEEEGVYYAIKPQNTISVNGEELSLKIDLGGIAKGYCADLAAEIITGAGFKYGYFDFGTSSMSVGEYVGNEDGNYTVGCRDPRQSGENYFAEFSVKNCRLSTSGDYEKYYEVTDESTGETVRYCHIINPATGQPIQTGVASVTVSGGSACEDDALTTALSCMGAEAAEKFMQENYPDKFYLILDVSSGKIYTNNAENVSVVNTNYTLS